MTVIPTSSSGTGPSTSPSESQASSSHSSSTDSQIQSVAGLRFSHTGFSLSTFQNTSDANFARNSNWGQYQLTLFNAKKQTEDLAVGGGVDILTEEGRTQICDLVLEANGNTLRFSVEWADIMPDRETHSLDALIRYQETAAYIKQRGITPIITFHHFVEPLWFTEMGGFEREENIAHFVNYCALVYNHLADVVEMFVTFNEPAVPPTMSLLGDFPPKRTGNFTLHTTLLNHIMLAHCQSYDRLHEMARDKHKNVQVGLTHQSLKFIPSSPYNPIAQMVCSVMNYRFNGLWMDLTQKHLDKFDFFGVQYYTRPLIGGFPPKSTCRSHETMVASMNFRYDPTGIQEILEEVSRKMPATPLLITETGTAGDNTKAEIVEARRNYYQLSLQAVSEAQAKGVNVIGYLAWTLFDNFEWNHGYSPAHGFGVIRRAKYESQYEKTAAYHLLAAIFATATAPLPTTSS
jgi:beta-glucosidase